MNQETSLPLSLPSSVLRLTFALTGFLSFAVPFSLGHPQLLVGSIINACLFSAALFLPLRFIYPIIFFPSLGVLSRGVIFGPLTPFLILMMPFIWLANWLLVFSFKKFFNKIKNYWMAGFSAALLKYLFLFSTSILLFNLHLVPKLFLTTMGIWQLITALIGGVLAFSAKKFYDRFFRS